MCPWAQHACSMPQTPGATTLGPVPHSWLTSEDRPWLWVPITSRLTSTGDSEGRVPSSAAPEMHQPSRQAGNFPDSLLLSVWAIPALLPPRQGRPAQNDVWTMTVRTQNRQDVPDLATERATLCLGPPSINPTCPQEQGPWEESSQAWSAGPGGAEDPNPLHGASSSSG
jgi:hypothetical protein